MYSGFLIRFIFILNLYFNDGDLHFSGDVLLRPLHRAGRDSHQRPHHPRHHGGALLRNLPPFAGLAAVKCTYVLAD